MEKRTVALDVEGWRHIYAATIGLLRSDPAPAIGREIVEEVLPALALAAESDELDQVAARRVREYGERTGAIERRRMMRVVR